MQPDLQNSPEVIEATTLTNGIVALASGFRVTTPQQFTDGGEQLKKVKGAQKRLEELRTAITRPLNAALKAANDLFRQPTEQLANAERAIKGELTRFSDEQERIRREEQRKADEAAQRERDRLAAIARETERKAQEKAAADRKAAEEAAAAGRTEEAAKLAARADSTEQKAAEKAAAFDERSAAVVAPIIQREAPKVTGVSMREVWKFEITDPSKINPAFLMPDETKIRKQVLALKSDAAALIGEGVRIWAEKQLASAAG